MARKTFFMVYRRLDILRLHFQIQNLYNFI